MQWRSGHAPINETRAAKSARISKGIETKQQRKLAGVEYPTCAVTDGINGKNINPSDLEQFLKENPLWRKGRLSIKFRVTNGKDTLVLASQEERSKFLDLNPDWESGSTDRGEKITIDGVEYPSMGFAGKRLFPERCKSFQYAQINKLLSESGL